MKRERIVFLVAAICLISLIGQTAPSTVTSAASDSRFVGMENNPLYFMMAGPNEVLQGPSWRIASVSVQQWDDDDDDDDDFDEDKNGTDEEGPEPYERPWRAATLG